MSTVGQALGGIVGGVIGFYTGGPGGALKGAAYGYAAGSILDPTPLPGVDGPRLSDPGEQTSGYGVGLHNIDGKKRVPGHVFWIENNRRREVVVKEDTGGKGGGGSQETTTYKYYGTFAVMLADHQISHIERLWDAKGLVLNTAGTDVDTAFATSDVFPLAHLYNPDTVDQLKAALKTTPVVGPKGQIRLYPGFDDQEPDPRMEADLGVGKCPAMRGQAYLVFYGWPLPDEYAKSIAGAQISAEVVRDGENGEAVLLNEIQLNNPSGFSNPRCQYLTPDLSRVYYANGPIYPGTPPTAFGVHDVGPHGYQPGVFDYPFVTVNQHTGKGITDTDIGLIGLSDAVDLISAFPGRLSSANAQFVRKGAQGSGVWYAVSNTPAYLYVGFEETDSYDSLALGSNPYDVAMDDDGNAIVYYSNKLEIYDQSLTLTRTIDTTSTLGSGGSFDSLWSVFSDGILYVGKSGGNHVNAIYPFDMDAETVGSAISLRDLDTTAYPGSVLNQYASNFNVSGGILTRFNHFDSGGPSNSLVEHFRLPTPDGSGEDLAAVVRRRIEQSELIETADLDVTGLTGTVRGYSTQGVSSIRGQLEPLMLSHQFVLIQDGYQIKAVMRGGSSVKTIDPDDLDARPYGNAPGDALIGSREMDTQLPSVVVTKHIDADRDYEVNEQRSVTQEASSTVNIQEINLAEVLTPDEGAALAEIVWARRWLERYSYTFKLPPTYLDLQAGDVVTLPMDYATYELFINRANISVDGIVELEAVLNDSAVYTTNATGNGGTASATTVPYGGNSTLILLDIPCLYDEYNAYGYPVSMAGYSSTWPGGVLVRSNDNGQTWQPLQGFGGPVVSGIVPTALGQDDGYVVNYTDQLTVQFYSSDMSISSISEAQMLTGMNWSAYGADGRWEILMFANATDNGDGTYTLDTILRGCKGTEWATGLHEADDYFVFLSDADVAFVGSDINSLSVERLFRGATVGQDIDNVSSQAFTYTGVNFKPYAPTALSAVQSGADWIFSWDWRTRLEDSYFTNGVAVPLGEATESYELDIMNGSTVVRTLEAATTTATWTEAQQIADFGSAQSSVTYRVRMISAIVGNGYEAEATA
ncbi:phage tail protein [Litorivivens sp.]|uniref:phage tail protein n=1 Tax=Litorivivens sp. TaxID=2020868 RepID=UPI003567F9B5